MCFAPNVAAHRPDAWVVYPDCGDRQRHFNYGEQTAGLVYGKLEGIAILHLDASVSRYVSVQVPSVEVRGRYIAIRFAHDLKVDTPRSHFGQDASGFADRRDDGELAGAILIESPFGMYQCAQAVLECLLGDLGLRSGGECCPRRGYSHHELQHDHEVGHGRFPFPSRRRALLRTLAGMDRHPTAPAPAGLKRWEGWWEFRQTKSCKSLYISGLRRESGAEGQNRTGDTMIFSHVLYRLSYLGTKRRQTFKIRQTPLPEQPSPRNNMYT